MKVTVKSVAPNGNAISNQISLTKNDFLASGGEGEVYIKSGTAYKIYHEPSKIIPAGKVNELSAIKNPNVIRPQSYVLDSKNKPIGYTMRYVPDTLALCQLFTKAFRNRNNIDHDMMQGLIRNLHQIVVDVHKANILIVDLNEMNFLVSPDFKDVFAIDTDSYQTKSYKATAIMDSIRDRHCKNNEFNQGTDWFAYGIISFQMFTGIHPYKGNHPTVKSINDRMLQNISVFNKDVGVPKACYSFDVIPEAYKLWYKAIFDEGKRLPPPADFDKVELVVTVNVVTGSDNVLIEELDEYEGTILDVHYHSGVRVLTDKNFYKTKNRKLRVGPKTKPFHTPLGVSMLAKLDGGALKIFNVDTDKEVNCSISGQDLMESNGNLYVKSMDNILRVQTIEAGSNIIVSTQVAATVLEKSSKFFDGVLFQNILGAFYVSIFPNDKAHHQVQMKELDHHRIVEAKCRANVLMVITANKNGIYDRWVFRFNDDFKSYDIRKIEGITPVGCNFTVLDNGIVVGVNEDDNLEIFSSRKDSSNLKVVQDNTITSDMKLFNSGAKLLFSKENKLYSAKMK